MAVGLDEHDCILLALDNCIRIDEVLDLNVTSYRLPPADAKVLTDACFEFGQCMTMLIQHYHPLNANLFHFTIQTHYLMHFGLAAKYINPAMGACHAGEDLMKVVKRLISSSAASLPPDKARSKAIDKYLFGLGFSLSDYAGLCRSASKPSVA